MANVCHGAPAPVATAIFSLNGNGGDLSCGTSLTLDEYTLGVSGGISTEADLGTGVREVTPLEGVVYVCVVETESASDVVCDDLTSMGKSRLQVDVHTKRC